MNPLLLGVTLLPTTLDQVRGGGRPVGSWGGSRGGGMSRPSGFSRPSGGGGSWGGSRSSGSFGGGRSSSPWGGSRSSNLSPQRSSGGRGSGAVGSWGRSSGGGGFSRPSSGGWSSGRRDPVGSWGGSTSRPTNGGWGAPGSSRPGGAWNDSSRPTTIWGGSQGNNGRRSFGSWGGTRPDPAAGLQGMIGTAGATPFPGTVGWGANGWSSGPIGNAGWGAGGLGWRGHPRWVDNGLWIQNGWRWGIPVGGGFGVGFVDPFFDWRFNNWLFQPVGIGWFPSPWYGYIGLPPYLGPQTTIINVNSGGGWWDNRWDGFDQSWVTESRVGVGEATDRLTEAFRQNDTRRIRDFLPTRGEVEIRSLDKTYRVSAREFTDMFLDGATGVRTREYRVTNVRKMDENRVVVEIRHVSEDPWGDAATNVQRLLLVSERTGWTIRGFQASGPTDPQSLSAPSDDWTKG